jgi:hypothetical protein
MESIDIAYFSNNVERIKELEGKKMYRVLQNTDESGLQCNEIALGLSHGHWPFSFSSSLLEFVLDKVALVQVFL